jgi:hypothetical protein
MTSGNTNIITGPKGVVDAGQAITRADLINIRLMVGVLVAARRRVNRKR